MKNQILVLLPLNGEFEYDRKDDAERIKNEDYHSIDTIRKEFPNCLTYDNLADFTLDSNDELIDLEKYWVTYVNIVE